MEVCSNSINHFFYVKNILCKTEFGYKIHLNISKLLKKITFFVAFYF